MSNHKLSIMGSYRKPEWVFVGFSYAGSQRLVNTKALRIQSLKSDCGGPTC